MGGILDNDWGDEGSDHWKVRLWFGCDEKPQEVLLHGAAASSSIVCQGVMDTRQFKGDTDIVLPEEWRNFAVLLLRCLYSPDEVDYFLDACFLFKTLNQMLEATKCAVYLGLGFEGSSFFWIKWYEKVRSQKNKFFKAAGNATTKDTFRFPDPKLDATWHGLPLEHAMRWLAAFDLSHDSVVTNIVDYLEFDGQFYGKVDEETVREFCADTYSSMNKKLDTLLLEDENAPKKPLYQAASREILGFRSISKQILLGDIPFRSDHGIPFVPSANSSQPSIPPVKKARMH